MTDVARCAAAHGDDSTPCDGPPVVKVLDVYRVEAEGCGRHAARLLASLKGGRVYPLPGAPEGSAIRVFQAAQTVRPFCWYEDAPRTRLDQLSHNETKEVSS